MTFEVSMYTVYISGKGYNFSSKAKAFAVAKVLRKVVFRREYVAERTVAEKIYGVPIIVIISREI